MPRAKLINFLVLWISFLFIILRRNIDFRMKKELWYLGFLNQKGRPLSVDYQSEEKALSVEDALQAIELLKEEKTAMEEIFSRKPMESLFMLMIFGEKNTII